MDNLNRISHPFNENLVQTRRYILIGMDPIMPKYSIIATSHLDDEEGHSKGLVSNGKLHVGNPLS